MQQTQIKWKLITFAYLGLFSLALIDNGRGPIYPTLLDLLSITPSQGSYIFSIASIIGVAVNMTARWWLYPIGAVGAQRLSLSFLLIGSLCFSASGHYASYPLLIFSAFLLGIGLSICSISMNLLVAQGSPEEKRKNVFAGLHSVYGVASFMVPFLILGVNKLGHTWMTFFSLVGLICFIVLIWSFKITTADQVDRENREVIIPLAFPQRILFGLIFAFYVSSEITISTRLVLYLERAKSFNNEQASFYLSIFFALLLAGRLFFAFFKVNFSNHALMLTSLISTLISFAIGYWVHPLGIAFCGLTMSFFFPMAMDWLAKSFPKGMEFMTASAMTSISLMLGVVHWGFGQIADQYGVVYAMLLAPICSISSLVCLFIWKKRENAPII